MRTRTERITFRLREDQRRRYESLIGKLLGVRNWTDLVLKSLHELAEKHLGPKQPLGTIPAPSPAAFKDQSGRVRTFPTRDASDTGKALPVSDKGLPKPSTNGKPKGKGGKNQKKRLRKVQHKR